MDEVTEARRRGDADSNLDVLASTMKLIGNSGSVIMDKQKHQDVKYVANHIQACKKVN